MNKRNIFSVILSVIFSLIPYYQLLKGNFVGYPALKWAWVNYEHWFQFLQGNYQLRELNIFYPYVKSLGFSDAFMIQGFIYSFYRFTIESRELSLVITNLTLAIFFSLGILKIGQLILKNTVLAVIFNFLVMTSYFYAITLGGAQTPGYALAVWTIYFGIRAFNNSNNFQISSRYFRLFLISLPILALSTWYAAFFIINLSVLYYLLKSILDFHSGESFTDFIKKYVLNYMNLIYFLLSIILWTIFLWIYFPVKDIPIRTWEEVLSFLPRIIDFINASGLEGGFLKGLYSLNIFKNGNYGGITPFLFLLILLLVILKTRFTKSEKIFFLTMMVWYIFIVKFNNQYSFYYLFWKFIPGYNSIRDPSRAMIIFHIGILLIVLKYYSQILIKKRLLYFVILIGLIFFEQIRFEQPSYKIRNYLLEKNEIINSSEIDSQSCSTIFFLRNGYGWWKDQIDGMVFANYFGLRSVNGYSGATPINYPNINDKLPGSFTETLNWIYSNNKFNNICIYDENGIWNLLNDKYYPPIEDSDDLYSKESNSDGFWYWTKQKKIEFKTISFGKNLSEKTFVATIINNPCKTVSKADFIINNVKYTFPIDDEIKVTLQVNELSNRINSVSIDTDATACKVENDNRSLYFQIKNVKLS
jgi:hypothetical protein